jgi:hypothetical protein
MMHMIFWNQGKDDDHHLCNILQNQYLPTLDP